jgi:cytoskeleton protein RodZ
MPLDTGAFADVSPGQVTAARKSRLMLDADLDVGAALKAMRLSLGLSIEEIAEATRVKSRHIEALEASAFDQLPSRPFTIGYVRAYAKALGLEADQVAQRFRAEHPSPDDELRSPVGVVHNKVARSSTLTLLVGIIVIAVVGWNVARHAMADPPKKSIGAAPRNTNSVQSPHAGGPQGVFNVAAPLAAPPEATAPPSYQTPIVGADSTPANAAAATKAVAAQSAPPTPFVAGGAIYGPTAGASNLVIQARKSISLEVVGPGGVVYFARQLAPGEAYRVPSLPGLTAEVSNPENAEIFQGGVSKGVFTAPQMPLKTAG